MRGCRVNDLVEVGDLSKMNSRIGRFSDKMWPLSCQSIPKRWMAVTCNTK
jgi:hypothetical protein